MGGKVVNSPLDYYKRKKKLGDRKRGEEMSEKGERERGWGKRTRSK